MPRARATSAGATAARPGVPGSRLKGFREEAPRCTRAKRPRSPCGRRGCSSFSRQQPPEFRAGARWYDPKLGRFISVDPVLGNITAPQRINRYSYVLGNPYKYIDPFGEDILYYNGKKLQAYPGDWIVFKGHVAVYMGIGAHNEIRIRQSTDKLNGLKSPYVQPDSDELAHPPGINTGDQHPVMTLTTAKGEARKVVGIMVGAKSGTQTKREEIKATQEVATPWEQDNQCSDYASACGAADGSGLSAGDLDDAKSQVDPSRDLGDISPDVPDHAEPDPVVEDEK